MNRIRRTLATAALALTLAAAPLAVSAHSSYCGYGASGWTWAGYYATQTSWAGQQVGNQLLMLHDNQGIWAPSDHLYWCQLY